MTEQPRQPAGVQENGTVPRLDPPVGDESAQPGQRPRRVGGVEEDALGAGGQPHRHGGTRGQRGVTSAHLTTVDLQPVLQYVPAGHSVEKLIQCGARVGDGAGVNANDPVRTEAATRPAIVPPEPNATTTWSRPGTWASSSVPQST